MKNLLAKTSVALLVAFGAQAAPITWGPATTISSDADIFTGGTLKYAYYFTTNDTGPNVTLNGITFNSESVSAAPSIPGTNGTTDGNILFHNWDRGNSGANTYAPLTPTTPWTSLSAGYQTLLREAQWTSVPAATRAATNAALDIELRFLTIGAQYTVQLWGNDSRATGTERSAVWSDAVTGGNTVNLDLNTGPGVGSGGGLDSGLGRFTLGTFTADATSQTIYLIAGASANLSALQVVTVPEPSSIAFLGLGVVGRLLWHRRKSGAAQS